MRVEAFDFELPPDRIALHPARPRDSARLLCANPDGAFADRHVRDLPGLLQPGDLLVVNDTRVIPASLSGARVARGDGPEVKVEAMLHRRVDPCRWRAFVRPAKRLRTGEVVRFGARLEARVVRRDGAEAVLEFNVAGDELDRRISEVGNMPLPPYILARRPAAIEDADDYQTAFAEKPGAVAAPTAGLHFTPALLEALGERDVAVARVTLHVGAGTFLPVKAEQAEHHSMHAEWREVPEATVEAVSRARERGGRVVAVGTTALRSLESAVENGRLRPARGETDIFIRPGFAFSVVDGLWTNFHLPRSTLFMLVAAFVGLERAHALYAHAIAAGYRFYSYGDASLLWRKRSAS